MGPWGRVGRVVARARASAVARLGRRTGFIWLGVGVGGAVNCREKEQDEGFVTAWSGGVVGGRRAE